MNYIQQIEADNETQDNTENNSSSKYHSYFDHEDENPLVCLGKRKTYTHREGKSTSSLKHLSRVHQIDLQSSDAPEVHIAVLEFLVHHDLPLALLDCPCFREMARCIASNPSSPPPCASTATNLL